jgi:CopG family nickel-responsive transcriptional regulator
MSGVTRIGVSLEPELLDAFDEEIMKKGYGSRSEALRDLVRDSLAQNEWKNDDEWMVGIIVMVYDHTLSAVGEKLTDVQHAHHDLVKTSVHIHLDETKCMEILICEEKLHHLKEFSDEITSIKGVLRGRLTMVAPSSGNMHHVGHRHQ